MAHLPLRISTISAFFSFFALLACSDEKAVNYAFSQGPGESFSSAPLLFQVKSLPDSTLLGSEGFLDSARRVFVEDGNHYALAVTYDRQAAVAQQKEEREKSADLSLLASSAYETADSINPAILNAGIAGMKYVELSAYAKSTQALQYRLELATTKNDSSAIGWSLNALSLPYQYSNNMDQAKDYLMQAKEINETLEDQRLEAAISLNLGNVYSEKEEYEQALTFFKESYRISDAVGHEGMKWLSLNNMANINLKQSEYTAVIEMLSGWDKGRFDNIARQNKSLLHYNLARAHLGKNNVVEANYHVDRACEMAAAVGNERGEIDCIELKALLAENKGDLAAALSNLKEFHRLEEETTGEEANKQLKTVRESYEVKIRDQEIAELKEQEILRQQHEKNQRTAMISFVILTILTIAGITFSIRYSLRSRIAHQQKEIAEAQLHFLQARMSPHFVFNALNGIQNQVLQADPFSAYEYIGKFSGLLRAITNTTSKPEILLSDEIALLQNYLDLEQLRFRDGFSYTIETEEALSSLNPRIPAMMIQPVLENAIVHGLAGLKEKGTISVALSLQDDTVCCVVTDNGIGRKASAKISKQEKEQHLSISTDNLKKRFKALERLGYPMKSFTTVDLFADEKACGTQVTLYLPIINASF
ncbi:histidine kinase [Neolewinella agarilytica]|uniref:Tetratricopeptide repeat-containing protein n=1 Tax=Neolewinella agarilytica TaxID=478744 RepID=A0A1H9NHW6_9BACT|nr:histidine kinase [Neolewinella agarilytica]SER35491.1 Tetratricopeptide repeat-containing protein [Neolewinella agarilytica]